MKCKTIPYGFCLLFLTQWTYAYAQQEIERLPLPKLNPPEKPIPYNLRRIVQVKLDTSDTPRLICMVESFREEEREGRFTRFRSEQRTRTVTVNIDGEQREVEQTFTVRVPYIQTGKQRVLVPAGKKPVSVAWDEARLYRLDGSELSLQDAETQLDKLRAVFLVDSLHAKVEPADELLQQVLRPDTLILATDQLREPEGVPVPARAPAALAPAPVIP